MDILQFWGITNYELITDLEFFKQLLYFFIDTGIPKDMDSNGKGFDYIGRDFKFLCAAFKEIYGVSYTELSNMPYNEFLSLFEGLMHSENTVTKVMGYRNFSGKKGMDKEHKKFMYKMKALYK